MNIGPDIQTIQQRKDPHNQAIANALQKLGQSLSALQIAISSAISAAGNNAAIPIQILDVTYASVWTPFVTPNVQLQVWRMTLTGNISINAPYGGVPGQHFIIKLTQGGTGNYVPTWAIPYGSLLSSGDWQPSGEVGKACIIEGYFVTATELLLTNLQGSI